MMVRVVTAAQAAARDAAAIEAGTPSRTLMDRAGAAAAEVILRQATARVPAGATIYTGPGNNGGDGWVVARLLARHGVPVGVREVAPSKTDDARAARAEALAAVPGLLEERPMGGVVIDAVLGTGAHGPLSGPVRAAADAINDAGLRDAFVAALDLPTGIDATTGAMHDPVRADLTVTFGTVKRGHLLARGACGGIVVVDIGLGDHASRPDGAPPLVDRRYVASHVPHIAADAHKGVRKRVVIAGGARGMAGAVTLGTRAAARSGVGMVRVLVEEPSLGAAQAGAVEATASTWPIADEALTESVVHYASAVLVGPGLGRSGDAARFLEQLLAVWRGPTVLDADALNHFAGRLPRLSSMLDRRPAVLTPHVSEAARLLGIAPEQVAERRFEVGAELARATGATVLLKGVPTVITAPDGTSLVSASGTPVLAAAGSGDLLGGIAVTLLAQSGDPLVSAACAAWVHGRAAELANEGRTVRGVSLDDVVEALGHAWPLDDRAPLPPILAELPRAGDRVRS